MQFAHLFAFATVFGIATPVMAARRCVVKLFAREGNYEFVSDKETCVPPVDKFRFGGNTDLNPKIPGYRFWVKVDAECTSAVRVKGKMPKSSWLEAGWE